ncbi:MAG: hypothetical protein H0X30_32540 [Anaerolineae bacterium]|nr:hypothetical protein [Anaerolineae bacterium]
MTPKLPISESALQNAIGEAVTAHQGMIFLMAGNSSQKRARGEDVTELTDMIFTQQRVVEALLDILRAEGDPVYLKALEDSFPRLQAEAAKKLVDQQK